MIANKIETKKEFSRLILELMNCIIH